MRHVDRRGARSWRYPAPARAGAAGQAPAVVGVPAPATPLAALLVAAVAVAALLVAAFGWVGAGISAALLALAPAVVTDACTGRLPDRSVLAGGAVAAASAMICVVTHGWQPAGAAVAGAAVMAAPVLGIHTVQPSAMGFGDVKLAAVLGLAVGLIDWRFGLLALLVGAALGLALVLVRGAPSIAFGPPLLAGAAAVLAAAALAHRAGTPLLGWEATPWR